MLLIGNWTLSSLVKLLIPPLPHTCPAQWYAEGEKTNGRWAMAAVAGILFTDLIGKTKWFEAGSEEYWMPNGPLLAIEFLVIGFLELKRFQGWKETGTSGFLNAFPFDPAGETGTGGRSAVCM